MLCVDVPHPSARMMLVMRCITLVRRIVPSSSPNMDACWHGIATHRIALSVIFRITAHAIQFNNRTHGITSHLIAMSSLASQYVIDNTPTCTCTCTCTCPYTCTCPCTYTCTCTCTYHVIVCVLSTDRWDVYMRMHPLLRDHR